MALADELFGKEATRSVPPYIRGGTDSASGATCAIRIPCLQPNATNSGELATPTPPKSSSSCPIGARSHTDPWGGVGHGSQDEDEGKQPHARQHDKGGAVSTPNDEGTREDVTRCAADALNGPDDPAWVQGGTHEERGIRGSGRGRDGASCAQRLPGLAGFADEAEAAAVEELPNGCRREISSRGSPARCWR